MQTASSWDSFKDTLIKVLGEFKPESVFEWGPGVSTLIMQDFPSVKAIDTVEHDLAWWGKWKDKFGTKICLRLEQNMDMYAFVPGRQSSYDLIFIDGRKREQCLRVAEGRLNPDGVVLIHDAERPQYKPFIDRYRFVFFEDNGHTAVMTNSPKLNERLEKIFAYSCASA